ncbi:MAG TPA: head-tail connector protein [Candidatus Latescibacteria bacterium]|nr:head-tail connector protein [Candidatus Latescibacterota bacterium]HRU23811.1 head-tail connector protein [Candidatus Latescibacterota bacterium]
MSSLVVSSEPAVEPVTLTEAKLFARIDTSDDDALISALITTARARSEMYTGRTWVHTIFDYYMDAQELASLNSGPIVLPTCPLKTSSVTVKYYDYDGTENTFSASNYWVDLYSVPARLCLMLGQSYPSAIRENNGLKVTFTAGYSADATSVPEAAKTAIKIMVADMYEHREDDAIDKAVTSIPTSAKMVLYPLKVRRFW